MQTKQLQAQTQWTMATQYWDAGIPTQSPNRIGDHRIGDHIDWLQNRKPTALSKIKTKNE